MLGDKNCKKLYLDKVLVGAFLEEDRNQYETDVEESLSGVVALIEPTLVILLSVIIGSILLSVMLPLIGILSAIG